MATWERHTVTDLSTYSTAARLCPAALVIAGCLVALHRRVQDQDDQGAVAEEPGLQPRQGQALQAAGHAGAAVGHAVQAGRLQAGGLPTRQRQGSQTTQLVQEHRQHSTKETGLTQPVRRAGSVGAAVSDAAHTPGCAAAASGRLMHNIAEACTAPKDGTSTTQSILPNSISSHKVLVAGSVC